MIPAQIKSTISQVVKHISVNKTAGICDTLMWVIGHNIILLEATAAVMVYRECGSSEVLANKIVCHRPPSQPWGVEFHTCGKPGCQLCTYDFYMQSHDFDICMTCRSCDWQSAW
jgi:hypothetical protein